MLFDILSFGSNKIPETKKHYILSDNSSFAIKEAFKSARTSIIFTTSYIEGCKKIVVTSPSPGEGKTTTCINTAISFSQTGARVLLIDADLRRPKIAGSLGLDKTKGLANYLGGFCDLDKIIQKSDLGLDCIAAGAIPPNPAELLSSSQMEELLDKLSSYYDYIFIDTPPVNIVTDSLVVSKLAHGVILVTRHKYTTFEDVDKALKNFEFSNAKILGFILNDIIHDSLNYKYKYKYKYKQGYGYK